MHANGYTLNSNHSSIALPRYNTSSVYCRELAPGTVTLTGDWVRGDDSKQTTYYVYIYPTDHVVAILVTNVYAYNLEKWLYGSYYTRVTKS